MSMNIFALIEYDESLLYAATPDPPFSTAVEEIDLTRFPGLYAGKDYAFFAAISGFCNDKALPPLYALRGLPLNVSPGARRCIEKYFDPHYPVIGWLTWGEINAALAHMGVAQEELSLEVNLVLQMMAYLEKQLGKDRVR